VVGLVHLQLIEHVLIRADACTPGNVTVKISFSVGSHG
jgi:hypothetical protein